MAPQKLNPSSSTPLYKQVYTILKSRIANGELKPGDKIPTENELIQEYGVSRITIRAAISELVEDRVLERAQGKGTFVCKPKDAYQADDSHGFTQSCYLSGKIPKTTLLTLEYVLRRCSPFCSCETGSRPCSPAGSALQTTNRS